MDSEKRQKVMLAAAAVMSVGVGSYWLFGRDSGAERPAALVQGDSVRKPRPVIETPSPTRQPTPKPPSADGKAVVQRKPPPEPENTNTVRKPRPKSATAGTNKPPIRPAG